MGFVWEIINEKTNTKILAKWHGRWPLWGCSFLPSLSNNFYLISRWTLASGMWIFWTKSTLGMEWMVFWAKHFGTMNRQGWSMGQVSQFKIIKNNFFRCWIVQTEPFQWRKSSDIHWPALSVWVNLFILIFNFLHQFLRTREVGNGNYFRHTGVPLFPAEFIFGCWCSAFTGFL